MFHLTRVVSTSCARMYVTTKQPELLEENGWKISKHFKTISEEKIAELVEVLTKIDSKKLTRTEKPREGD